MRKQAAVLLASLMAFLIVLIVVERTFSPTFQQCVGAASSASEGDTKKEKDSSSPSVIYSYVRCTGDFLNRSEGAVTAIATIIIAAFTCTLWLATSAQG